QPFPACQTFLSGLRLAFRWQGTHFRFCGNLHGPEGLSASTKSRAAFGSKRSSSGGGVKYRITIRESTNHVRMTPEVSSCDSATLWRFFTQRSCEIFASAH